MDAIATIEADVPGKALHRSQAAIVQKTAASLGQIHDWKFQVPLGKAVGFLDNQSRPQEGGINDSKGCAAIGPFGISTGAAGSLGGDEDTPSQIEAEDHDENAANPEDR